jgi:quercetin dioxygenase-like cupin family protein
MTLTLRRVGRVVLMMFASALGTVSLVNAQQSITTPILTKALPDFAGKEVVISTVVFPAGVASAPHRHDAHTFVYVLEGTVIMQVSGGPLMTLSPGQTFYETPADVHATSKNASQTAPAKILVFMIKDQDKPAVRPAN